jgi:hypothetical protein
VSVVSKEKYKLNPDKAKKRAAEWVKNNPEKAKTIREKYREKPETIIKTKISRKKRYLENYNAELEYRKTHKKERNLRDKERRLNDPLYNFSHKIKCMIIRTFKNKDYKKNYRKTEDILGCHYNEFIKYIEGKFEPWMTWENRGKYNGEFNHGWDIDHIIPLSTATCEEDIVRLNHHTNLQPLCSKVNRDIKKNNLINML